MATIVTYNGVRLHNVLTEQFDQSAVYDESGTDLLYHRFRLAFSGIVHIEQLAPQIITAGTAASAAASHRQIRALLMAPRAAFEMQIGTTTVLSATGRRGVAGANLDVRNGPHPQTCKITTIAGSRVLKIVWEVEVCLLECFSGSLAAGSVLNNRWSVDDDFDDNFFCRRTITGRLVMAADADANPNRFRGLVIPRLERNFRWVSGRFTATTSGLELDYSIVHQQVHHATPGPATTWKGTHTESTNDGVIPISEINLHLEGPPNVDKPSLLSLAVRIAEAKLKFRAGANVARLEQFALVDNIGENSVDLAIRVQRHDPSKNALVWGTIGKELGKAPELKDYDPSVSVAPPASGEFFGTLYSNFVAYLQDPCGGNHAYPTAGSTTQPSKSEPSKAYDYPQIEYSTSPGLPEQTDNYSEAHRQAVYTHYAVAGTYETAQHKVQMPVAAAPSTGRQPTCVIIPLALPTARRVVTIAAERAGEWPVITAPRDYDDEAGGRATLIDHQITPQPPKLGADGQQKLYSVDATFWYALERAPSESDSLRSGALPYAKWSAGEQLFPTAAYVSPTDSTKTVS